MKSTWLGRLGGSLVLLLLVAAAAPATTLHVALDVQGQGLTLEAGGVGLQDTRAGLLSVNIGGPVQGALLYWAGRDRPCPESAGACVIPFQPYKDQVLTFDGNTITGTVIGTEGQPISAGGPINNIGYLADVTSIVQAKGTGLKVFSVADADLGSNLFRLNGATLVVIYTNPADTTISRMILYDGLDFAYGIDPTPGPTRVTVPVTFSHGAEGVARQAQLLVSSGDGEATRPDRIDISNNPSVVNGLNSSAGHSWDADWITVNIPAGVASTTVQLFSEPLDQNPDSLLWILGALRIPLPPREPEPNEEPPGGSEGCTPGYWKNHTESWAGSGYSPNQTVGSVFSGASAFPSLASQSLLQALQGGGGSGTLGAAKVLLRAATAALLNAAHTGVDYPRTSAQIISDVNAALTSNNRNTMLALATALDKDNNGGCPLN
jgi:hypothetical protein